MGLSLATASESVRSGTGVRNDLRGEGLNQCTRRGNDLDRRLALTGRPLWPSSTLGVNGPTGPDLVLLPRSDQRRVRLP